MIVNIKFLSDFLVPENLGSTLLDMQINSSKCSFFRVAQWFDFTNFITEKQNRSDMSCCIHKRVVHWSCIFWTFTFWDLLPEINCTVALTEVFLEPDFLHFGQFNFCSTQVCDKQLVNWTAITDY